VDAVNAILERRLDPLELPAHEWDDLGLEERRELLIIALNEHPKLVEKFYSEAIENNVDPFEYYTEM
jgi:hypothetical protein